MFTKNETATIARAIKIMENRLKYYEITLTSPDVVRDYLITQLSAETSECFCVLYLDNRHRLISFDREFSGTIDGCSVHPRVIVKHALDHNAAAVILAHNHPSGVTDPSSADITITKRLQAALELIDVRVLDHIIVGGIETVSFAEIGRI